MSVKFKRNSFSTRLTIASLSFPSSLSFCPLYFLQFIFSVYLSRLSISLLIFTTSIDINVSYNVSMPMHYSRTIALKSPLKKSFPLNAYESHLAFARKQPELKNFAKALDPSRLVSSSHLCGLLAGVFTRPPSSPLIVRGSSRTDCPRDNDTDVLQRGRRRRRTPACPLGPVASWTPLLPYIMERHLGHRMRTDDADDNAIENTQFMLTSGCTTKSRYKKSLLMEVMRNYVMPRVNFAVSC